MSKITDQFIERALVLISSEWTSRPVYRKAERAYHSENERLRSLLTELVRCWDAGSTAGPQRVFDMNLLDEFRDTSNQNLKDAT